jgi:hypothetical protein
MIVHAHILSYCERDFMPWALAHYSTFADRIFVHDARSPDGTRDVIAQFPKAECVDWDCPDEINDGLHRELKNNCWKGRAADWCIVVDCDELVHSPTWPMRTLLETYDMLGLPVAKCTGYELYAEEFPAYRAGHQVYDVVKHGAREATWYDKSALFSPRRISEIGYDAGAHNADAVLLSGERLPRLPQPTDPPCWLLHCKHLGPVERVQREYATDQSRLSAANRRHGWGVCKDPDALAVEKRSNIVAGLQRLFA